MLAQPRLEETDYLLVVDPVRTHLRASGERNVSATPELDLCSDFPWVKISEVAP